MGLTAPFCEATPISYLALFIPILFYNHREYILALILLSVGLFYRIQPGIPLSPILVMLYIGIIIVDEKFFKLNWNIKIGALICFISAIFFIFISAQNSITGSTAQISSYVFYFSLIYFSIYDRSCNIKKLERSLLLASVIGVVFVLMWLIVNPTLTEEGRFSLSAFHNCNVVARGLAIMTVIIFATNNLSLKGVKGAFKIGVVLIGLFAIFLTGGRMSFVASIVTMALCFLIENRHQGKLFNYILIILAIGLISTPFFLVLEIDFGRFEGLFSSNTIESNARMTSGEILWHQAITKNPFMGIGIGNENSMYILEYIPDADNMYIDALTQVGIIGLSAIIILIISSIRRLVKYTQTNKRRFSSIAIPISLIAIQIPLSFTESVFDEMAIWYAIAIVNIYINNLNKTDGTISNYNRR